MTESRIAMISIMVEDRNQSKPINEILSQYGEYVVGRMGIPYPKKSVSVICIVFDAPTEVINSVTGKIGQLSGVQAKTLMSKI